MENFYCLVMSLWEEARNLGIGLFFWKEQEYVSKLIAFASRWDKRIIIRPTVRKFTRLRSEQKTQQVP